LGLLQPRKVKIPYVKDILKFFPVKHIIMRTHFGRFCDFIKAAAVLHQYNRKSDEDNFVLANGQDYDYAREIIMGTTCNDQMVPLTKNQKELLDIMKEMGPNIINNETLGEKDVGWNHETLFSKIVLFSKSELYKQLNKLVKMGFIQKDSYKFEYDLKTCMVYKIKEQFNFNLPKWENTRIKEIVEIADKWIDETTKEQFQKSRNPQ